MQEEKRFYRWCMYGNYHPDFELKSSGSFLSRLKRFCSEVTHRIILKPKRGSTGLKSALAGAILIITLGFMFFFQGCRTQQVPVETTTEIRYVDSVVCRDSVVIIPTERIVDIAPWYDTLHLESTMAWSEAWIDTNYHIIQGQLVNKQGKIVEIRYVDRVQVRDSIVVQEKPVYVTETVEKVRRPWWAWICLTWTVITLCSIAFVIFKKIKGLL